MTQGYYDRPKAIAAILSFYKFFSKQVTLDSSYIKEAPAGGWPSIDATFFAPLKRNDDVIDLLRHIPYIIDDTEIAFETHNINYSSRSEMQWDWDHSKHNFEGSLFPVSAGVIPPHVAVLTKGGKDGSWLLLDTQNGTITDFVMFKRPVRDDPPQDSPDAWRAYPTMPIVEFFEQWKNKYRTLDWIATPDGYEDGIIADRRQEDAEDAREIYRAHGWPDSFRREECKEALVAWKEKWYRIMCEKHANPPVATS